MQCLLTANYSINRTATVHLQTHALTHARTHTHTFNGPLSGTTRVGRYQKGKTKLDFTEARECHHSEWQWHPLGHMQVCSSLQADNHASTPPLSFLQAGCPSCRPTNSIKELKASFTIQSRNEFTMVKYIAITTESPAPHTTSLS